MALKWFNFENVEIGTYHKEIWNKFTNSLFKESLFGNFKCILNCTKMF